MAVVTGTPYLYKVSMAGGSLGGALICVCHPLQDSVLTHPAAGNFIRLIATCLHCGFSFPSKDKLFLTIPTSVLHRIPCQTISLPREGEVSA